MQPGYYDEVEEPEEAEHWLWYVILGIPLVILTVWDITRAIPRRVGDWFKTTFARY